MPLTHILVDFENTQPKADEVARAAGGERRLWIFRGPGQKKYEAEFAEALLALGEQARVVRCEKSGANALDMHIAFELGRLAAAQAPGAAAPAFIVVSKDTDYEPLLQYLRKLGYAARREKTLKAVLSLQDAAPHVAARSVPKPPPASAPRGRTAKAAKAAPPAPAKKAAKASARPAAKAALKQEAKQEAKPEARQSTRPAAKQPAARSANAAPSAKAAKASHTAKSASAKAATPAEQVARVRSDLEAHPRSRPVRLASLRTWLQNRNVPREDVEAVITALQSARVLQVDGSKVIYSS
jgi:hypothetical protein